MCGYQTDARHWRFCVDLEGGALVLVLNSRFLVIYFVVDVFPYCYVVWFSEVDCFVFFDLALDF